MKKILFLILLAGGIPLGPAPDEHPRSALELFTNGILEKHDLESTVFGNSRLLRVLLPSDYYDKKNSSTRYKVLYMNDGQGLFDKATSVFNTMEWEIDETLKFLACRHQTESIIVVGIDNAGKRMRPYEYLPWPDEYLEPPCPDPEGKNYPKFVVDEVMPFVDARYRTRSGPENTGLGGSSYGGLITLYTAIERPGVFGFILMESPSFYVKERAILDMARNFCAWPKKVYFGVGTNELGLENCKQTDGNVEPVRDIQDLYRIMIASGVSKERICLVIEECALHNEEAWARRFPKAILFWLQDRI